MKPITLVKFAAALACGFPSVQATPIFLGSINDGVAPSVANEVGWVNQVLTMTPGTSASSTNPAGEFIIRSSIADPGSGSVSTPPASQIFTVTDPSVVGTGFEYVIAHWGGQNQMSAVWYLGGAGLDIPDDQSVMATLYPNFGFSRGGYSGYTVYNGTNRVPDGASTMGLVGLGILGLALLRRKLQS